jgi:hypothetical protein
MRLSRLLKDGISSLPWPLLTRLSALRNVIRAMPDPVLVYQMSKVGSSTGAVRNLPSTAAREGPVAGQPVVIEVVE